MAWTGVDCAIPAPMGNERQALPTGKKIVRRSIGFEHRSSYSNRPSIKSLDSFTSNSSVSSRDQGKIADVQNICFLNDNDMQEGQSSILGKGAFATVRLARRHIIQRNSVVMCGQIVEPDHSGENHNSSEESRAKGSRELVAVKIFEKVLLQKYRTLERDEKNQMQVRTALEKVEREIAVMKMIQHPCLVSLHEVIDTGSNRLYMLLEYLPLGEIMTNVQGTGMYKRRPARNGEHKLSGVTPDGYFDEHHAALYFVDIMHGLAHLHKNHIVHRDLKPENILLDSRGFAKIGDFGVAHLFEDEVKSAGHSSLCANESSASNLATNNRLPSAQISRTELEYALKMEPMGNMGKLTRTEGTWAFWSPEMCAVNALAFSGYACDIWAAGICLYVFATGNLPFFSENPSALFDMIAAANIEFDNLKLSDALVDMLKKILAKDPCARAGVGDCLNDPFCKVGREQRKKELGEEMEVHEETIDQQKDMRLSSFSTKNDSRRSLARGMRSQVSALRQRLSSICPQTLHPQNFSADDKGGREPHGTIRQFMLSAPFLPFGRRSLNKMSELGIRQRDQQNPLSASKQRRLCRVSADAPTCCHRLMEGKKA